jgi:hypothetical protein
VISEAKNRTSAANPDFSPALVLRHVWECAEAITVFLHDGFARRGDG